MLNPAEFRYLASAERDFWWFRGMRRILEAILEPAVDGRSIHRVLDVGCGTGFNARLLEQEHGWSVYACDLAAEAMPYAKALGVARLAQGDVSALPFPDGFFDGIFCLDLLPHFQPGAEKHALTELARVTAPGGLLVLRVAALNWLRSRHSLWANERQRFARKPLRSAVEQAGYRVLRATYANSLLLPVAFFKFRIWEPLLRRPPASGLAPVPGWVNNLLFSFLRVESVWLRAGFDLSLGQSLLLIAEKRRL